MDAACFPISLIVPRPARLICKRVSDSGRALTIEVSSSAMSALGWITVSAAVMALLILAVYWLKRPKLGLIWRVLLFLAFAALPTLAAGTSTVSTLERTTEREFCGSCHVMDAHLADATDAHSQSLAARHTRNEMFGGHSCYKCHANYGMYGYVLTKMDGMKHVFHYYFGGYGDLTLEEAVKTIHINQPFPNSTCLSCHAGTGKLWRSIPDHLSAEKSVRDGTISCASVGCHGAAHPFSKLAHEAATARYFDDFLAPHSSSGARR